MPALHVATLYEPSLSTGLFFGAMEARGHPPSILANLTQCVKIFATLSEK